MKIRNLSIFPVIVCLVLLIACSDRTATVEESSASEAVILGSNQQTGLQAPSTVGEITPQQQIYVSDFKEENEDAVGFLYIPYTPIQDVVVFNDESNQYYLRRNLYKQDSFEGAFYADYRSDFGDGTRNGIGMNTCIYGHTLTTDPNDEQKMGQMFGPLHQFRDEEFARETPYLFFSTESEDMAFEVIAVFIANCLNPAVPYNHNNVEVEDFLYMLEEEIKPRSLYHYDIPLEKTDKFLTLSTCIYNLPDGTTLPAEPDNWMRFAVMGRLVGPEEAYREEAVFTVNEDLLLDPPGNWRS